MASASPMKGPASFCWGAGTPAAHPPLPRGATWTRGLECPVAPNAQGCARVGKAGLWWGCPGDRRADTGRPDPTPPRAGVRGRRERGACESPLDCRAAGPLLRLRAHQDRGPEGRVTSRWDGWDPEEPYGSEAQRAGSEKPQPPNRASARPAVWHGRTGPARHSRPLHSRCLRAWVSLREEQETGGVQARGPRQALARSGAGPGCLRLSLAPPPAPPPAPPVGGGAAPLLPAPRGWWGSQDKLKCHTCRHHPLTPACLGPAVPCVMMDDSPAHRASSAPLPEAAGGGGSLQQQFPPGPGG